MDGSPINAVIAGSIAFGFSLIYSTAKFFHLTAVNGEWEERGSPQLTQSAITRQPKWAEVQERGSLEAVNREW